MGIRQRRWVTVAIVGILLVGALLMPSPLVTGGSFVPSDAQEANSGAQQADFAITGSTGKVLALGESERELLIVTQITDSDDYEIGSSVMVAFEKAHLADSVAAGTQTSERPQVGEIITWDHPTDSSGHYSYSCKYVIGTTFERADSPASHITQEAEKPAA